MDLGARLSAALTGRYEILREIGRGGLSVVFLARDLHLDREVALMALRPELTASVGAERFQREIQLVAHFEHIHQLNSYESGTAKAARYDFTRCGSEPCFKRQVGEQSRRCWSFNLARLRMPRARSPGMTADRTGRGHQSHPTKTRLNRAGFTLGTILVVIVVIAIAIGLYLWLHDGDSSNVARVELVPVEIHVQQGSTFQLSLRLRDSKERILAESGEYRPEWRVAAGQGWVKPVPGQGDSFVRTFVANSQPSKIERAVVEVRVGDHTSQTTVWVVHAAATQSDLVLADHDPSAAAEVALVTGAWAGRCRNDSTFALTSVAVLGDVIDDPNCSTQGQVALFSQSQRFGFSVMPWRQGQPADVADFRLGKQTVSSETAAPSGPRQVALEIWIAAEVVDAEDTLKTAIGDEVAIARNLLLLNRGGIAPYVSSGLHIVKPVAPGGTECNQSLEALFAKHDPQEQPDFRKLSVIHVVYCRSCLGGARAAYACPADSRWSGQIVMDMNSLMSTDLVHELGHVMGLVAPYDGHVAKAGQEPIPGFTTSNLMWEWHNGKSRESPSHFSLGQVFRMNADVRSWLCRSGGCPSVPGTPARGGQCQDEAGTGALASHPCPCLPADVLPPFKRGAEDVCEP